MKDWDTNCLATVQNFLVSGILCYTEHQRPVALSSRRWLPCTSKWKSSEICRMLNAVKCNLHYLKKIIQFHLFIYLFIHFPNGIWWEMFISFWTQTPVSEPLQNHSFNKIVSFVCQTHKPCVVYFCYYVCKTGIHKIFKMLIKNMNLGTLLIM